MKDLEKKVLTLCIIHQHPKVLLGMKKRGFGAGRWNGFGGKIEEGETIEEGMLREIKEEIGINALDLEKVGIIDFEFENSSQNLEVHVFKLNNFDGEPIESEEMKPEWFHVDRIPFDNMWPDDIIWMPLFLQGKKIRGRFLFDQPSSANYTSIILEQELKEVDEL